MWLKSSHNSRKAQFPSSVPFFFFFPCRFLCVTTELHQHRCTLLETWVSWEVFKKLGEKRQPLPAAAKAWFMPHQVLSESGLSARGCRCMLQSSHSSAARLRPAHPFSHGVQKPVLVWFGYSREQDASWIAHRLPTRPLNTFLSGLNWSNLSPLTLGGKTKPYLYSVGKTTASHLFNLATFTEWSTLQS